MLSPVFFDSNPPESQLNSRSLFGIDVRVWGAAMSQAKKEVKKQKAKKKLLGKNLPLRNMLGIAT